MPIFLFAISFIKYISEHTMLKLLESLESIQGWNQKLKNSCRQNGLKLGVLNSLTLHKVKNIYTLLERNYYFPEADEERMKENTWTDKQKSIFPFVLICLGLINSKIIQNFGSQEYDILQNIFKFKSRLCLQYETMLLIESKQMGKRKWQEKEERILASLVKEKIEDSQNAQNKMKWKQISKQLFQISDFQYFRMGKACREKWFNHLDPIKKHGQWTVKEDIIIIEYVFNKGKKWSEISKLLQNRRTEHMIKNRYKSLLIHHKKKISDNGKQQRLLFSLAKSFGIKEKIRDHSCSRRKQKQVNNVHEEVEDHQIVEESSSISQSSKQNCNVKIEEQVQVFEGQKRQEIKRQHQHQNNELNNFSPFCYVPTPSTVQLTPYYMNNSPSVPLCFNNFNNFNEGFRNVQYFFVNPSQQNQHQNMPFKNGFL